MEKYIIKLGDCGWSYITTNDEAAEAIKSVVLGRDFSTDDYDELDEEAKEVFDDFAENKTIWVTPYYNMIWEEYLKRQAKYIVIGTLTKKTWNCKDTKFGNN